MKESVVKLIGRMDQESALLERSRVEARKIIRTVLRTVPSVEWEPGDYWRKKAEEGNERALLEAMAEVDIVATFEQDEGHISRGSVLAVRLDRESGAVTVKVNDIYSEEECEVELEDVINPEVILDFLVRFCFGEG